MRRIHLIDSRIVAMMVNRLAMNGPAHPAGSTLAVAREAQGRLIPFVAMLIDIASRTSPTRPASAGIPHQSASPPT
jgi:hypothetical protein